MRRGSVLGILLELLSELDAPGPLPADARVGRFFRARRYLGARDRRVLGGLAYGWLRHRHRGEARWDAWASRSGLPSSRDFAGRTAALAPLLALARDGLLAWSGEELLGAAGELEPAAPPPWSVLLERAAAPEALGPGDWPADPLARLAAETSLPLWMAARLVQERGEEAARRLGALLLEEAPLDLRVNVSRVERDAARAALERSLGRGAVNPTPWSPLGLRLPGRRDLGPFQKANPGWIEVQDEGSQLVVLSADPRPADTVIDACAGAGGKTLALLDLRNSRGGTGEIHASDTRPEKLEELRRRARDLGGSVATHSLEPEGALPGALPLLADLVLVDAPCSGGGSLRRSPELKHRYGPEDIVRFAALQRSILLRFAARVRPGGRLVYSTCSLLEEENGAVVEAFLRERTDFEEVPSAWAGERLPPDALTGGRVRLDPLATGTDGFFVAALCRKHP